MKLILRIAGALALAFAVMAATFLFQRMALAHDHAAETDQNRAEWFKSLKPNGNPTGSCCNLTDCYQTEAKQLDDGSWMALRKNYKGSEWVPIPPDKVLKRPLSIDGEAYLCNSEGYAEHQEHNLYFGYGSGPSTYTMKESLGVIFCFVPPIPGY